MSRPMRCTVVLLAVLFISLLCLSPTLHAEGGCPSGMVPEGGQGAMSCRPLPGYSQGGAQAQPRVPSLHWVSRWGAIALDAQVTRFSGAAYNKASKQEAEQVAMKNCLDQGAKQCEIISAYANGCVALAGSESSFGVATGYTLPEAEREAVVQCRDATCQIIYSRCSLPQAIR